MSNKTRTIFFLGDEENTPDARDFDGKFFSVEFLRDIAQQTKSLKKHV